MSDPPSYDSKPAPPPSDLLPPSTLYIAERFIHPSDPQSPPLYELSHSVGFLKDSDRKVTFERLDYTVRTTSSTPSIATRKKQLYELCHRTFGELPNFDYQAEATSRAALCSMGIEKRKKRFSFSGHVGGYQVLRARWGEDRRLTGGEALFTAVLPSNAKNVEVSWEWNNAEDVLVAREIEREGLLSLVVTAEMAREERDALAAAWVMRLWWDLADRATESS